MQFGLSNYILDPNVKFTVNYKINGCICDAISLFIIEHKTLNEFKSGNDFFVNMNFSTKANYVEFFGPLIDKKTKDFDFRYEIPLKKYGNKIKLEEYIDECINSFRLILALLYNDIFFDLEKRHCISIKENIIKKINNENISEFLIRK